MDPNNWLLWLVIGVAAGWLIEFLIDYFFFGRRNRELAGRVAEARAETDKLLFAQEETNSELTRQTAANTTLQTRIDELEATAAKSAGHLQALATRRSLVGPLGNALLSGDREGIVRTATIIEETIAAKEPLEHTVLRLQESVSTLNDDLLRAQAALRHQADDVAATDAAENAVGRHQLGLLIAAGGLLGILGRAIQDGNETAIRHAITAVEAELTRAPEVVRVEVPDTRAVKSLKAEVANATAKHKALQIEVDDLNASTIAMISRIGLVTTAGGALGSLGSALASGDESAVMASVQEITDRMARDSATTSTQTS